jgi:hypothetical protein
MSQQLKICSACKIPKALSEFYRNRALKDGLNSHCKKCVKSEMSAWQKSNRHKTREYDKNWRRNNKQKVSLKNARYRLAHPDKCDESHIRGYLFFRFKKPRKMWPQWLVEQLVKERKTRRQARRQARGRK